MSKQKTLFTDMEIDEKIDTSIAILKQAEESNAILSFSGGIDSVVINDLIKRNNINIEGIFFNESVENSYNVEIIRKVAKTYKKVFRAKTRSYKEVVYKYGFPIQNKNFSELCYRVRKIDKRNYRDVYKVITGVSPDDIEHNINRKIAGLYSLDLKFWYFATTFPIQTMCCSILKKQPAKKINKPMIIGIMADDSPARRRAIKENKGSKKFYPLKDFKKADVFYYTEKYNLEISKAYCDRKTKNGEIILGSTNTGCIGCHYGNSQNHFYIDKQGITHKTTKFENLKRENERLFNNIMNMKHTTRITLNKVLYEYEQSKQGKYLKESKNIRNKYIDDVVKYLQEDGYGIKVIEFIKGYYE